MRPAFPGQVGDYVVTLTVRDKDGGIDTAGYPLTVLRRNGRPWP